MDDSECLYNIPWGIKHHPNWRMRVCTAWSMKPQWQHVPNKTIWSKKHIMAIAGTYTYFSIESYIFIHVSSAIRNHEIKVQTFFFLPNMQSPKVERLANGWVIRDPSFASLAELKKTHGYSFSKSPHWPRPKWWLMMLSRQQNPGVFFVCPCF